MFLAALLEMGEGGEGEKNFSITQACNFFFLKNIYASLDSRDTQLRYTESRVTSRLRGIPGRLGNRLPRIATRCAGAVPQGSAHSCVWIFLSLFSSSSFLSPFVRIVWKWIQDGHFKRAGATRTHSCVRVCVYVQCMRAVGDSAQPRVTRVLTFSTIRSGPPLPSVCVGITCIYPSLRRIRTRM